MVRIPEGINLAEYSDLHYEIVGEGFDDAEGQPTREGVWYLLGDHDGRQEYGVIVSGAVEQLPHTLPDPEKLARIPRGFLREVATINERVADGRDADGLDRLHSAWLRTLARHVDRSPAPRPVAMGPQVRFRRQWDGAEFQGVATRSFPEHSSFGVEVGGREVVVHGSNILEVL